MENSKVFDELTDNRSVHSVSEVMEESKCYKTKQCLIKNCFSIATFVGVVLGFAIAFGIRSFNPSSIVITWIGMPSRIYLNVLSLLVLPLIASNLLVAIASIEPKKNGLLSLIGFSYIIFLNLFSAIIGAVCAIVIKPGNRHINVTSDAPSSSNITVSDVFKDLLLNLFPSNIVGVAIYSFRTTSADGVKENVQQSPSTNMIGVLFCSIAFGISINASKENGKSLLEFFESLTRIVTWLMKTFILFTPIGVCSMIVVAIVPRNDIQTEFAQVGIFIGTIATGLVVHVILLVLIQFISSLKNPFRVFKYSLKPVLISFATTSPALCISEAYNGLDEYGVEHLISRFTTPIAAAMKGDGPAIFIASSCIFIAEQSEFELGIGTIMLIICLTFASSLAVPNIPSASIVLVIAILSSIGVPTENAGILFAIDWLLDRLRSANGGLSIMYVATTTEAIFNRVKQTKEISEV